MSINLLTPSTQIVKLPFSIIGFKKQLYHWLLVLLLSPFGLIAQVPTISNFTPTSGSVGTLVTITGTNLNNPTALTIGGISAIAISNTGTSLVAMVMPGAATGTVSVTTVGGAANGTGNFTVTATGVPNTQQGNKLVGTGSIGTGTQQGGSVAVSADGNTAMVGGNQDNSGTGAVWVYTRSGGVWTQQGAKLVGTGATGSAIQGSSVALSADGNTAIVGGPFDNSSTGAVWVYIRSGGTWTQQGSKLVGTGAIGAATQGFAVSLSADGNTAMVGGGGDNSYAGAAWVYTRSAGTWTQQGSKLVGSGGAGFAQQGSSVSVSADGNTAIVGGNGGLGAWVYTRSAGTWTQQGNKLVGTGAVGNARQGNSVAVSADGNTAIVGGFGDNSDAGAAWVYTRSAGTWTQQGSKLVGSGAAGSASQGYSVSLSADGNTAVVGGYGDNSDAGAAWVYTRSGGTWTQQGSKLVGTGATGTANQGYAVSLSADGSTAIVSGVSDNSSTGAAWVFAYVPPPPTITSFTPISGKPGDVVTITGTNFNSTTTNNIVFFGATRASVTAATATSLTVTVPTGATYAPITLLNTGISLAAYSLNNFTPTFSPVKSAITATDFSAKVDFTTGTNPYSVAIGDLDEDGKADLAVVNQNSNTVSVYRNTASSGSISTGSYSAKVDFATGSNPTSVAIGDIDGDGKPDLVVANNGSDNVSVLRNIATSGSISTGSFAAKVDFAAGTNPISVAISDLDSDGKPDLAVANSNSANVSVLRNAATSGSITSGSFSAKVDFATGINPYSVAIGDLDGDGKPDLAVTNVGSNTVSVLRNTASSGSISTGSFAANVDFTTGTSPASVAIGDLDGDGKPDLAVANAISNNISLLRNTSNSGSISTGSFSAKVDFATGTTPYSVAIGDLDGDGKLDLAVANYNANTVSLYQNTSTTGSISTGSFAAKVDFTTGSQPQSVAIGDMDGDGKPDLATTNYGSNTISLIRNAVPPPTITSFTPISGKPGDVVTITGTNFNTTNTNNIVFFGATKASVTSATATSLTVTVPTGATYAPITLLNTGTSLAAYSRSNFTPTFSPAKTSITAADFSPKQDFTAGTNPYSVAIGDLDGDGKPDLAVANYIANTVSVYRNTSTSGSIVSGSFAAKQDFTTGSAPISVAIGDLDGDGKPDLAVANQSSASVSVFRNTATSGSIGLSSFAAKLDFTTGGAPTSLAIGDLDGNGKPELAVANRNSNTVSVLRNTSTSGSIGSGSFAAKQDFTTGSFPYSVAIGDLDGDGKPDLAVANNIAASVSVFRNTSTSGGIGSGSFAAKQDFTTGSSPYSVAIGDLDGDGKADLAVASNSSNTVSVFRNTSTSGSIGSSSFAAKQDFTTGTSPFSVVIGDLDGDGKPDLAAVNQSSNSVSIMRNTSTSGSIAAGSFAAKQDFTTGTSPFSLAISDLDGDGKPDLATSNYGSASISVLRNAEIVPPPTLTSFTPISGKPGDVVTITGTNFNTTTTNNIVFFGATRASVTVATATSLTVTVPTGATYAPITLLNTGISLAAYSLNNFTPTFNPAKSSITAADFSPKQDFTTGTSPYSAAIGDLDGDGKPDLAVANSSSNTVSVYRNTSTSGSIGSSSFAAKQDFTTGSFPLSVAIGDLDGDGKADLAVANVTASTVSVLRNTSTIGSISSGSFAAKEDFGTGAGVYSVAIGDLDGDGKADLAVANNSSNTVSVLRNTSTSGSIGSGSFTAKQDFTTGTEPVIVAIGDLDGDGKPDLATANRASNSVSVLRNTSTSGSIGSGSFATKQDFTTGSTPYSVAIGDLDGDGKLDLAVANQGSNTVSVYRNTSTSGSIGLGSFATKQDFTTGSFPYSVAIGDLDGNGKPDLAVANASGSANTVSIYRNTSTSGSIGSGSFATKADFATGINPYSVVIGDLDGDGRSDLATANSGSSSISVLRNADIVPPPTITNFTATSGPVGTLVTITGTNLSSPTAINIGGVSAIPISNTGTSLVAMVMPGATNGVVSVSNAGGTANGTGNFTVTASQTPNGQQGNKLVGTGAGGNAEQGRSVSISADGNTAIVGGYYDNSGVGAAWVYTRTGGLWTQQGNKLVGTGAIGNAQQGWTVSISADGNTAIVGGYVDDNSKGAIWAFTRTGSVWTQQGAKLVGTGAVGNAQQGGSIFLSADGNTAIVGGNNDNSFAGAAWVFTRSGGVWSQQGNKLVGTGATSAAQQGQSVSLSADGNTAIVGGYGDNSGVGAAWVYTRSGSVWSQQGTKLVGTGAVGNAVQGWSVSLSADGNTAMVGGTNDNSGAGAVWVYTRSASVWTQQGNKLVGTGAVGNAQQGYSISLSADGNTAIVGGTNDNVGTGAAWVYTRSASVWTQQGNKLVGMGAIGAALQGLSASLSADGNTLIVGGYNDNSSVGAAWAYTYIAPVPTITSFTPLSGKPGDVVTITGSNFNTTTTNNIVFFGATRASVTAATTTSLTVTVPTGATYAPITLLNIGTSLAAYSRSNFIPTFSPAKTNITAADFSPKQDFTAGTNPYSVAIGDLDGDGKADLAVANTNSNTVSIYRNTSTSGSIGSGSFAAKQDFITGSQPFSVAIGDLDGDGKPDLAVTNGGSSTVSIYHNTATSGSITTSSFAAKQDFTTGFGPYSLAIGDLDGDGKADLAVANYSSTSISVLRNTSTSGSVTSGSFAAKQDFANGSLPISVAIGDLDGDGKADIAVANQGSASVSVYRNTSINGSIGSGSFAAKQDFTTGLSPSSVAIGDLDGDGKADLAVANQGSTSVSVLRNTSTSGSISISSFAAKQDFTTGSDPVFIAIGDLDGDGKADLTVANQGSNSVSIMRNTSTSGSIGAGSFAAKQDFSTGIQPYSVAIGDLDGDGKPDLAAANYGSASISVLRNTDVVPPPTITSFTPISGKPGDVVTITGTNFNATTTNNIIFFGATRASVTAATATSLTVTVPTGATYAPITLLNTGTSLAAYSLTNFTPTFSPAKTNITAADFSPKQDFTTGANPSSMAVGDLDGDGKADLAVANFGANTVSVYRNTSTSGNIATGSFAAKVDFTTGRNPFSVAIGDLDGDGKPDLAVTNGGSSTVSIYRNTAASGSITTGSFAAKVDFATGTNPYSVSIRDLDGDGKSDLAVANFISNTVSIYRNTATSGSITTGSFAAKVDFTTGTNPYSVSISDLDGDGKSDLAVANFSSNTVSIYRNTATSGGISTSSFAAKVDFATGSVPYSVAIGDLDGDGKADLAVANYGSNTVSLYRNTTNSGSIGVGSFAAKVDFTAGTNPYSVAIGDLDGDGKADLAVANNTSNTVSVFRNTSSSGSIGSSSFAAKQDFTTGVGPRLLAIGDLDGDSKPDLAVPNFASSTISVLRNADALSTNADLSAMTVSTGTLAPVFAAATITYTASVTNATTSITVTPTNAQANATIHVRVNGGTYATVTSSSASGALALNVGTNTIDVRVTAQDGTTQKIYTTTVTRAAASVPTINTTGSLVALTTTYGTASTNTSFTVSGTALTNNIVVTAPTGYEISTTTTTGFGNTLSLTQTAGAVANTTIFVRLKATNIVAASPFTGNITCESINAVTVNVATASSTVTQAPLTITANNANKIYGAELTGAAGSTAFTSTGLLNGETIGTVTIAYGTGSAVTAAAATYTSSVTPSSATGGTFTASNYNITYSAGNIIVGKAGLTIIASDGNKVYGATLTDVLGTSAFSSIGLLNGESIAAVNIAFGTGSSATAVVGTYNGSAIPSAATGGTFTASNYNITYNAGNINVTPAPLIISVSNATKIYGTTLTGATGSTAFTSTGLGNGEIIGTVTIAYGTGASSNSTVGTYTGSVTPSAATGGTFTASNYTITYATGNIVVTKAPLTISVSNANKVYGTTLTGITSSTAFTSTGLLNGETIGTVAIAYGTGASANSAVGTYNGSVTPSLALGGTFVANNYTITYSSANIIITTKALTISGVTVNNKVFDGNTTATLSGTATLNGVVGSDNVTISGTPVAVFANSAVANNIAVTVTGYTLSGTAASNYTLTQPVGLTANITPVVNVNISAITITGALNAFNSCINGVSIAQSFSVSGINLSGVVTLTAPTGFELSTSVSGTYSSSIGLNAVSGTLVNTSVFVRLTTNTAGAKSGNIVASSANATDQTIAANGIVNALPVVTAVSNFPEVSLGTNIILTATSTGTVASYLWSPAANLSNPFNAITGARVLGNTTYTVTVTTTQGCIGTANVTVTTKEDLYVEPINVFTPNGDGINDRFVIKNLDQYPNNKLQVFDRTGKVIYQQNNYTNTWDGTAGGKLLTKDTYFYVLTVKGQIVKRGTITVVR